MVGSRIAVNIHKLAGAERLPEPSQRKYFYGIDFIRFGAALSVVTSDSMLIPHLNRYGPSSGLAGSA
jgi:hypothetical protein